MKRILFFAFSSALVLSAFLILRPIVANAGTATPPDTAGRAKELLPEERSDRVLPGVTPPSPGVRRPSPVAGAPLEAIEQQIVALTNEARRHEGLAPLIADESLRRAARGHGKDMIERAFADTINPDGLTAEDRASRENRRAIALIAENLGAGSQKDPNLARSLVSEWMGNPGEREKILRSEYTQVGVGVVPSGSAVRAVQLFARTVALTDTPVPSRIAAGKSIRVALASSDPSVQCNAIDLFSPGTGLAVLGPMPFGQLTMNVPAGVYKLRLRCTASSGPRIYAGPRVEVTP